MFSPLGGLFNRYQGTNALSYLDRKGTHWTPGNDISSSLFMEKKKYMGIGKFFSKIGIGNDSAEMRKAILFFDMSKLHQDLRDVTQKASKKLGKEGWKKKISPLYWAITKPEYLNQGQAFLNVLQDQYVTDNKGNKVQVFNGKEFLIYDNIDLDGDKFGEKKANGKKSKGGTLILKSEFKNNLDGTPNIKNIENWEKLGPKEYTDFKIEAQAANIEGAGDYAPRTGMSIKDANAMAGMGKYVMPLSGWVGSILGLKLDRGVNLATGSRREHSDLHSLTATQIAMYSAGLAFAFSGLGLFSSIAGLAALGGGGALLVTKILKKELIYNVHFLSELVATLKLLTLTAIGIPSRSYLGKDIKIPVEEMYNVDTETANSMRAIAAEMVKVLFGILAIMGTVKVLKCKKNDSELLCAAKTAALNLINNLIHRRIQDIQFAYSPSRWLDQFVTPPFPAFLFKQLEALIASIVAVIDSLQGNNPSVYLSGHNKGRVIWQEKLGNAIIPSVAKQIGVFESKGDYENKLVDMLGLYNLVPGTNIPIVGQPSLSGYDYTGLWFTEPTYGMTDAEKVEENKKRQKRESKAKKKLKLMNQGYSNDEIKKLLD